MFASCKNDVDKMSSNEGVIDINVNATNNTVEEVDSRALSGIPDVGNFTLELKNSKEELVKTWERFSDFVPISVGVDSYIISAFYGDKTLEGFDALSYYGSTEVQVNENQNTEASIVCTINKALVSISYTDAFKNYFSDYSAYIETSVQGRKIEYIKTESRSAYFVPGDLKVFLLVERNGVNGEIKLNPKNFTAQAQTEYRLTMDVDASTATLRIIFNDNPANVENVEINISDSSLNSDPPVIMSTGFENGVEKEVLESSLYSDKLQMFLNAQAGLSSCSMEIQSDYLTSLGWPSSLELTNITVEQKALIEASNLKLLGFGENKEKMAVIDFASFISNLACVSEGDEIHTFTVTATDNLTKVSEPVVLKIKTRNNKFSFTRTDTPVPYFTSEVGFDMTLEGDQNAVSFEEFVSGSYAKIDPSRISITPQEGSINSKVVINYPSPLVDTESEMKVKATINNKSKEVIFRVDAPELTLSLKNGDADVWATKAYLNVAVSAEGSLDDNSANTYEILYKNEGNWEKWPNQVFDGNSEIVLTGLNHNMLYTVCAVKTNNSEIVSASSEIEFTTEEKRQIPNSGFEDWYYTRPSGVEYWEVWYACKNGESPIWNTMNELTTSEGGSSGGAFNSNRNAYRYNANSGTIKTEGNGGGFAALIRAVGWGKGNNAVGSANAKYGTVGELYLGSYNPSTKLPDYSGIEFKSRPTSVRFDYMYYPGKGGDQCYIEVILVNNDSGESTEVGKVLWRDGTNIGSWTNKELDIEYYNEKLKPSRLIVKFKSGDKSGNDSFVTVPNFGNLDNGEYVGSQLYIDNVELIYE